MIPHLHIRLTWKPKRPSRRPAGSVTTTAITSRLLTAAMWCLVACGPLALLASATSHTHPGPAPVSAAPAAEGTGPAGFAELYIDAYLSSGGSGTALQQFLPDAPATAGPAHARMATATTLISLTQISPGYWSVVVAAREATVTAGGAPKDTGLHYFETPVAAGKHGSQPSYVATALPAEIAAPPAAAEPQLGYDTVLPIPAGPLTAAATQFLAAYLTGAGNLARYLAPGAGLSPVTPSPYVSLQAVSIYPQAGTSPDAAGAPAAGTRLRVLAQVQATDSAGGQWPLTYALTLTSVAGQWDIAAIDPAPLLGSSS